MGIIPVIAARKTPARSGTAALVATPMCPPWGECVVGELVWTSELCDDRPCQCEWSFNGVASSGITMAAEVRRFDGIGRGALRRALVERMTRCCYPAPIAAMRADALLDLAASHPEGALFRLEEGRPVAFPPGSRVVRPHEIECPPPGPRR